MKLKPKDEGEDQEPRHGSITMEKGITLLAIAIMLLDWLIYT